MHAKALQKPKSETKSRRIDAAVKFLQEHEDMSLRKAAQIFDVAHTSISRRQLGHVNSQEQWAAQRQLLTPIEEETLTKWALQYHAWGLPLQISHLKQFALEILLKRKTPHPHIGKHWHLQFLNRNPRLKVKLSSPLDRSRMSACTPKNLKDFYDLYHEIITTHQIQAENTWNMDEKGTLMGCMTREFILIPKEERNAFIRQDGKREWVSSLESISAAGKFISTFLIIKACHLREDFFKCDSEMTIHTSVKGWTSNEIALTWLKYHFEPQTRPSDLTAYRLLIVDGHDSHCSIEFIEFCCNHKICLLILPAHTTHILQPLDVGVFGPLSRAYTQILDRHNRWDGRWIDKASFIEYYSEARKTALTYANITSAFEATGIHPFMPSKPLEKLRPHTPPCQITFNAQGKESITIQLQNPDEKTVTQVIDLVRKSLIGTPARELQTIIESLFTTTAILSKANSELVANAHKSKAKKKRLPTAARWLTTKDAEELRAKQKAKEEAAITKKIAATNRKAQSDARKTQTALDRSERRLEQQVTREFKEEYLRLAKIHKTYNK
jgi:hypothetical protein